jgi:replicative DNA helicase
MTVKNEARDARAQAVHAAYEKRGFVRPIEEDQALATVFRDRDRRIEIMSSLAETRFSSERTQIMFAAMQRLAERNMDIDAFAGAREARTIAKERKLDIKLEPRDFGKLLDVPPPDDLEVSMRQLYAADQSRQIVDFAAWAIDRAENYVDINEFVNAAQEKLSGFKKPQQDTRVHYGTEMTDSIMRNVKERKAARAAGKTLYIDWPWDTWNRQVGIHTPGKIFLFAMPDGHGKSTYGVQIAEHQARRGLETFVIALEDTIDSIQARLVAKYAHIPFARFITGEISDDEEKRIEQAMRQNLHPKLHFLTMPGASASEILHELEIQTMSGHKPQAVIIDYLEALSPSGKSMKTHGNFYDAQGADVMNFVAYSSTNGVPFMCFDQMRKDFLSLTSSEKEKRGRSLIAGSVDKSRASAIIVIGENGGTDEKTGQAGISLWVDKANNSQAQRKMNQWLHGPTYTVIDSIKS